MNMSQSKAVQRTQNIAWNCEFSLLENRRVMDTVSSYFQIEELPFTLKSKRSNRFVKSKDERWKKFPSTAIDPTVLKSLEKIEKMKVFDDDIFLTGFMRSGTTLVSEMVWLIANNFDYVKAKTLLIDDRFPVLE